MARKWRGHFDSTPDDERLLMAEDWAKFFRDLITTGVRNGGDNLRVTPAGYLDINIRAGMANIEGYILRIEEDENGTEYPLTLPTPHNQFPRIDRVILRLDRSIETRDIIPMILTGVASNTPAPPELVRNDIVWDISLARIRVAANSTTVLSSEITDERLDESVCGLINSVLGLDSSVWQTQFDEFMAYLGTQNEEFLDNQNNIFLNAFNAIGETAGNLLNLIETAAFTYTNNNFDDWSAKPGTTRTTVFHPDGSISEQYVLTAAPETVIADKFTEFPDDSAVIETVHFYSHSFTLGTNTVQTVDNTRVKTTAFNPDETITEVIL
jgi:hypothetical protein